MAVIEIEEICRKILRHTVLDIYYLIMDERDITKTIIAERFKKFDKDPEAKLTKFRSIIDLGIAKLEGAQFIDSWKTGVNEHYFLTSYGEAARDMIEHILEEDPTILNGSRITKLMAAGDEVKR